MADKKSALIVWGGWEGHQPREVAEVLERALRSKGFSVEKSNALDAFRDGAKLKSLDLIVPHWTMGDITPEQLNPLIEAVESGVGIGGCHGGLCDAFRHAPDYQFMTGGQWVAHPGTDKTEYRVNITNHDHFITRGIQDFDVTSEQYYLLVDPAVKVLATTHFPVADGPHVPNGPVDMPVVWTKMYGKGRVFYCSIGHNAATVEMPPVLEIMTRGLAWAAGAAE